MSQAAASACSEALYYINVRQPLPPEVAQSACVEALLVDDPTKRAYFLGSLLHGMMAASPDADQVTALLRGAFSIDDYDPSDRIMLDSEKPSVTTIGSGKKGLKTVNISTMAAITASSTGKVVVCKPISSATSSLTGSADFASILGIRTDIAPERMRDIALETGLGIFSVASCVPKFVDRYDGTFFVPHAMSFGLAGLLAPYRTDSLVYGLAHSNTKLSYEVYKGFGVAKPTVVSSTINGIHYVDEALPLGRTCVSDDSGTVEYEFGAMFPTITPESFTQVVGGSQRQNVAKGLRALVPGKRSELRHTIALNAGLFLSAAGVAGSIKEGYRDSIAVIDDGQVLSHLRKLISATGGDPKGLDRLLA